MRKVLALILAVTMVLAGNVWAFAETTEAQETTPIVISYEGKTYLPDSDTPILLDLSINLAGSIGTGLGFESTAEVVEASTVGGAPTAELRSCTENTEIGKEGTYKGTIMVTRKGDETLTADDVGKIILEDVINVKLKDDPKTYSFNVQVKATDQIYNNGWQGWTNNGEESNKLYMDLDNVIYFVGADKANLMANNDYTVIFEAPAGRPNCIEVGEVVKNGSKFSVPVRPTEETTGAGYNVLINDKDGRRIFGIYWMFDILPASEAPENFGANKPTTPDEGNTASATLTATPSTIKVGEMTILEAKLIGANRSEEKAPEWKWDGSLFDSESTIYYGDFSWGLKGAKPGTTTVTIAIPADDGKTYSASTVVTVVENDTPTTPEDPTKPTLTISPAEKTMKPDERQVFTATLTGTDAKAEYSWDFSDRTVARFVDSNGPAVWTVMAVKEGKTDLTATATTEDGKTYTATAKITVSKDAKPDDKPDPDDKPNPDVGGSSGGGSGSSGSTNNAANSEATTKDITDAIAAVNSGNTAALPENAVTATTAAGATVTAIPVSLTSGSANISLDTANLIGSGRVALRATIDNGAMEVLLPGGFGKITEPGRIYYPLNFSATSEFAAQMKAAVKGTNVQTETVKAGGSMTLPVIATVTLRTKLTGTVNVYHFDEVYGRYTKLATTTVKDGKITFATKLMGNMVITTGTI